VRGLWLRPQNVAVIIYIADRRVRRRFVIQPYRVAYLPRTLSRLALRNLELHARHDDDLFLTEHIIATTVAGLKADRLELCHP